MYFIHKIKMSSWAEEYERMKKERLAQEAANKNKNVGFSQPRPKVHKFYSLHTGGTFF